uniref:Synaptonemal complex central element protein 2 n=1 Tax=Neolamprologus brichardi TaxID=32507 RepID=A0A3Q4I639_NEOBR
AGGMCRCPSVSVDTVYSRRGQYHHTTKLDSNRIYICCSSRTDDISRKAQESVEKINQSRISNQKMIDSFQEKLVEKVTELCMEMKEHMYRVYEENSDKMQVNLQELQEVLENAVSSQHVSGLSGNIQCLATAISLQHGDHLRCRPIKMRKKKTKETLL